MQRKHHAEAKKGIIEEKARRETEAIEMEQKENQQQMIAIQEQMKKQKEEAFRQMEQDKRDRERRELLRREHDASLNRPRQVQKPVVKAPIKPIPRRAPANRSFSNRSLPFEPENELEEALVNEYQCRSEPDPKLPAVKLQKRSGYYWIGQRRFDPVLEAYQVYVKEGSRLTPFGEWIVNAERVESLRLKGLQSAHLILLHSSSLSSHR